MAPRVRPNRRSPKPVFGVLITRTSVLNMRTMSMSGLYCKSGFGVFRNN